ncbi:antitoxin VbhA family protein [Thalassolituus alkanivorans]|jgi:hypothetical protein|uniref:antitoxin VbhA family protein n=1 Tax=Thalassolituus alkanivorans TaxID=2881055 RepID=UPI001E2EFB68|nr:hypothetical protein [Thalassolituus alkanivorans]MCB2385701.1 hypothetical protein [Thalassolituus alkanivorans]MCB2424111.1 hypothetical protein [Thalassolituus alkanivorans]
MSHSNAELLAFKVRQAVGSMAIEGVQVSRQAEANMLKVASGRVSGKSLRQQLVEKYTRPAS